MVVSVFLICGNNKTAQWCLKESCFTTHHSDALSYSTGVEGHREEVGEERVTKRDRHLWL